MESLKMEDWEDNLHKVDKLLYQWMIQEGKTSTTPPECIEILENEEIYRPTDRPGSPFRHDLREARKSAGIKSSEPFIYNTEHLKFEQKTKNANWYISLR